jgi:hypothetical protein
MEVGGLPRRSMFPPVPLEAVRIAQDDLNGHEVWPDLTVCGRARVITADAVK